jgi:large subunit ribosomal protein L22
MSPAPRKKKDAETAEEVEAKVSEEAGKSVPRADGEAEVETTEATQVAASSEDDTPKAPAKKKPATKKKAAPKETPAAEAEASAEEASADEVGRGDERSEAGPKKPARSRKKAEPEAAAKEKPKRPARRRDQPRSQRQPGEAAVLVSAKARYVRTSARKARLVCDHIRGKDVEQARAILSFTPRGAAKPWLKLLESAIANAEHNHELVGDELKIASIHADEGPTLKRYRPRAMGRATRIRKRTSHLTITLTPKE